MLLLLLIACPSLDEVPTVSTYAKLPEGVVATFTCGGDARNYDESNPAFVEETEAWGLEGFTAANMMTVDLDGDGFPDLIVNEANGELRDDPAAGVYYHRVLMNREVGGRRVFVDETDASGLLVGEDGAPGTGHATYAAADVDRDGDLDLFAGRSHDDGNEDTTGERDAIFLNDGAGRFSRVVGSGVGEVLKATISASFTEVNGDGFPDLWVVSWYAEYGGSTDSGPPKLYEGNGDGTFVDVTDGTAMDLKPTRSAAQYLDRAYRRPGFGATACDVDGDGSPELIQSTYARSWNLMFSQSSGEWAEIGEGSGMDADDGLDYRDNYMYACFCEANACDPAPTIDCGGAFPSNYWTIGYDDQPARLAGNTFTTVCGDIDNDGDFDLYHTEIHHKWGGESGDSTSLLLNDGSGSFVREDNEENGLARKRSKMADWNEGDLEAAFFDYDADGWKDILLVDSDYEDTHMYAWRNEGDGSFSDVSDSTGLNQPWPHGEAIADFDRDGDLDVVTGSSHARGGSPWTENTLHMWENGLGGSSLRLSGLPVGTRVDVDTSEGTQTFDVSGGYGVTGQQQDTVIFVGLNGQCSVSDLRITPLFGQTVDMGPLSGD